MFSKRSGIIILILLIFGIFLSVYLVRQVTQTKQVAFQSGNINKGKSLAPAKNTDGTMGPAGYLDNYSNTIPKEQLGTLIVLITDPDPTKSAFPTRIPTVNRLNETSLTPSKTASKPAGDYKSLIIQIKKVEVHLTDKDKWETLQLEFPMSMDLLQLQDGNTAALSTTKIAGGKYSEIRLYVSNATAVLPDNSIQNLNISDNEWIVRIEKDFNIIRDKNTTLTLDFDAQHSIVLEQNRYHFKPKVLDLLVK